MVLAQAYFRLLISAIESYGYGAKMTKLVLIFSLDIFCNFFILGVVALLWRFG
jgi:hypothetical protein